MKIINEIIHELILGFAIALGIIFFVFIGVPIIILKWIMEKIGKLLDDIAIKIAFGFEKQIFTKEERFKRIVKATGKKK